MKRGFTLVEVLTVILIIGILTTITTYTYNSSLTRSRDSQRQTDLKSIQNTLEQFYLDNRTYPELELGATAASYPWVAKFQLETFPNGSWPDCNSSATKSYIAPKYMSAIPEDPLRKLTLSDCAVTNRGSGQYVYIPLANSAGGNTVHDEPVTAGYYLLSRMERPNNVVANFNAIRSAISSFSFTRSVMSLPAGNQGNPGGAWPNLDIYYCSVEGGDPNRTQCDINYFLSNRDR